MTEKFDPQLRQTARDWVWITVKGKTSRHHGTPGAFTGQPGAH